MDSIHASKENETHFYKAFVQAKINYKQILQNKLIPEIEKIEIMLLFNIMK